MKRFFIWLAVILGVIFFTLLGLFVYFIFYGSFT